MNRGAVILAGGAVVLAGAAGLLFFLSTTHPIKAPEQPERSAASAPATSPAATPRATPARRAGESRPATDAEPTPAAAKPRTTASLFVESDVPETTVFVNRVFKGEAPLRIDDLAPGSYQINLSPQGYESVALPVEVTAGEEKTLSWKFKEVRLNERIAAVHKHGIGSCSGTLSATPRGLAYETTHADAFLVPLTELEAFEVNYIEKNLRVRVPGGKTFNFSDPDGNADRLYLFHQNVEKARKRLKDGKRP
jgi:hypothetical protein